MKNIAATLFLFGILVAGCAVPVDNEGFLDDQANAVLEASDDSEDIAETAQALDVDCVERTCVSCGPGKFQTKTVKYLKRFLTPTTVVCSPNIASITYGTCSTACAL